jgi:hypothetical protein
MPVRHADDWFQSAVPDQRNVLLELRRFILSVVPDAVEEIKWSRPCYSTPRGMFCYLHSTKGHATLGFQRGASLRDPGRLLEGTGKEMRHIKFRGDFSPRLAAVLELLKQAAAL